MMDDDDVDVTSKFVQALNLPPQEIVQLVICQKQDNTLHVINILSS